MPGRWDLDARSRAEPAHRLARMTTSMVDWTVALNTATKLVKPGPEISREGAAAVVGSCAASPTEPRRTSAR